MMHEGAILVTRDKENIKFFKYWHDLEKKQGKIEITWKDEDGELHSTTKEYKATKDKLFVTMCIEAVIKYWKKYDPQRHDLVTTAGHFHKIIKKRT